MHGSVKAPFIQVYDDILPEPLRATLNEFLHTNVAENGWKFGWKSKSATDIFSFWHRHFAGYRSVEGEHAAYDCAPLIEQFAPVAALWRHLADGHLKDHRLIRCYANGSSYGSDGTVHVDTVTVPSFTTIYYPHKHWKPDWAGETMFFNPDKTDLLGCVYPKPNRMVVFDGRIPHVARGVSRICPALRVTLMFKTDMANAQPRN